jgi:hypothetical protein
MGAPTGSQAARRTPCWWQAWVEVWGGRGASGAIRPLMSNHIKEQKPIVKKKSTFDEFYPHHQSQANFRYKSLLIAEPCS